MRGVIAKLAGLALMLAALAAGAEEARQFRLSVPPEVAESGLMGYLLPRFALKTSRRVELVSGDADAVLSPDQTAGAAVMARGGTVYALRLDAENAAARRFADWLNSEIGQRTIAAFQPPQGEPFQAAAQEQAQPAPVFEGDAALGRKVAAQHCARCHRTDDADMSSGIGSTPSFPALRALPDWEDRFTAFYVLNPHPAFLQVAGISPPFDPSRPPPIVPVELTLEEVEALLAYAASLPPADLGAEIVHQ